MAPNENTAARNGKARKAAPADESAIDAQAEAAAEANEAGTVSPAEAIHELGDTLGRAWSEARASVSGIGAQLGQRARNVRQETRAAASETRDGLQDAIGGMGELGEEIADDAIELGRAVGVSVSAFVRRHPMRSVAIAAAAGMLAAHLLRRRGR
ncbi:hypothetical protein [Tahibacter harae]|uniref:ElaB/YqjD/DUF883 family membrane-anchored ribosome-binding protein n=1 Tax=Tahibacter harae TaxID=2963937 RepID=A0ABT1QW43_9GAMM|nr:hypothetical protein [Tahibacter harae]MCQ4166506.1 hypothetical protein [Tahibacter harae]